MMKKMKKKTIHKDMKKKTEKMKTMYNKMTVNTKKRRKEDDNDEYEYEYYENEEE